MQQNQQRLNSLCIVRLSAIGDVQRRRYRTGNTTQNARNSDHMGDREGRTCSRWHLPGIEFVVFDKRRGLKAYLTLRRRQKSSAV